MGLADNLKDALGQAKDKATEFAGKHNSTIGSGLDKVGEMADKATKGKYSEQIHTGRDKAKQQLDHLTADKTVIPGETVDPAKPTDTPEPPAS